MIPCNTCSETENSDLDFVDFGDAAFRFELRAFKPLFGKRAPGRGVFQEACREDGAVLAAAITSHMFGLSGENVAAFTHTETQPRLD